MDIIKYLKQIDREKNHYTGLRAGENLPAGWKDREKAKTGWDLITNLAFLSLPPLEASSKGECRKLSWRCGLEGEKTGPLK